ncbi:MAG: hypothetical protein ACRDD1_15265 [Planctomycetia bacterium]
MQRQGWLLAAGAAIGVGGGWCLGWTNGGAAVVRAAPMTEPAGLIALTASAAGSKNALQLVYLVDPQAKVLSVYEYDAAKSKMKLAAVRHFGPDHQLAEFNNESPSVAEIESLGRERR